jgi:hypothetical protein
MVLMKELGRTFKYIFNGVRVGEDLEKILGRGAAGFHRD